MSDSENGQFGLVEETAARRVYEVLEECFDTDDLALWQTSKDVVDELRHHGWLRRPAERRYWLKRRKRGGATLSKSKAKA